MHSRTKRWLVWSVAVVAVAVSGYVFSSVAFAAFSAGVSVLAALLYLAAYVVMVVAIPLAVFTMFRFVYSLWLRPFYRAWHIHRIRNARYLREVIERTRNGE